MYIHVTRTIIGATVSMENAAYTTPESSTPVQVCAEISNVPSECDVSGILTLMDGEKASMCGLL